MKDIMNFSLTRQPRFDAGDYNYTIHEVCAEDNVMTSFGIKSSVTFRFDLASGDVNVEHVAHYYYSTKANSPFMQFMQLICDGYQVKSLNLGDLIGTTGKLTISHVTDNKGNIYENISEVSPTQPLTK